jgi:hypothetical protein
MAALSWQEGDSLPSQWQGTAVISVAAPSDDVTYQIQQFATSVFYAVCLITSPGGWGTTNSRIGGDNLSTSDQAKAAAQKDWDSGIHQ